MLLRCYVDFFFPHQAFWNLYIFIKLGWSFSTFKNTNVEMVSSARGPELYTRLVSSSDPHDVCVQTVRPLLYIHPEKRPTVPLLVFSYTKRTPQFLPLSPQSKLESNSLRKKGKFFYYNFLFFPELMSVENFYLFLGKKIFLVFFFLFIYIYFWYYYFYI